MDLPERCGLRADRLRLRVVQGIQAGAGVDGKEGHVAARWTYVVHHGLPEVCAGPAEEGKRILTNQEKKAKLNQYREAEAEAARLDREISRLYSLAEKTTTVLNMVPSTGGDGRALENAVDSIMTMADKLGEKRLSAVQLRRGLEDAIASVPDGRLRMLLRYRYIDGMTWERIAVNMGYERRHITRLHGEALTALQVEF